MLVENFRAGTLAKYGLDHESLRELNPRLVYLSVTGFGQTGPYADRPGYDGIFQAMSGMMSVSGHPEEPMKVGVSMVDILTGLYASTAVLAALRHRDVTGEGQFIDLSLLDCGLASLSHFAMNYLVSGEVPQRRGNGGYGGIPSQAFPCKDKPIFLVAGNDKQFAAFCAAADRTDLLQDPRFATTSARIAHREEILPVLAAILRTRTRDEWLTVLDAHDVPAGPYNEMPEVFADPQIQHRGMLVEVEDPVSGQLPMLANPIRFTATPVKGYAPPPALGEHTAEVLTGLAGLTEDQLAAAADAGRCVRWVGTLEDLAPAAPVRPPLRAAPQAPAAAERPRPQTPDGLETQRVRPCASALWGRPRSGSGAEPRGWDGRGRRARETPASPDQRAPALQHQRRSGQIGHVVADQSDHRPADVRSPDRPSAPAECWPAPVRPSPGGRRSTLPPPGSARPGR